MENTSEGLSAFYIELWQHMDAFFDDHRWMQLRSLSSSDERLERIEHRYEHLREVVQDQSLLSQAEHDLEAVKRLTRLYQSSKPEPGSLWFKQADTLRSHLQELGLDGAFEPESASPFVARRQSRQETKPKRRARGK